MRECLWLSEKLYGVLLHLYPKQFRAIYSQQMRLTFRDACRVAYHRNGVGGLLALWLPTLFDLFKSALEEQAGQGEVTMLKARLIALAGPLTILMGVLWVIAALGEFVLLSGLGSPDTFWDVFWLIFIFLSFIPMPFALSGTLLRFQPSANALGNFGLRLSVAGCLSMIVLVLALMLVGTVAPGIDQSSWFDYGAAICFFCLFGGYMLFGIATLRYNILPRWNLAPLLIGIPMLLHPLSGWYKVPAYSLTSFAVSFIYLITTGVCWILIGIAMIDAERERQPALTR